jgi:uncharacterized protein (DUF1015 family)
MTGILASQGLLFAPFRGLRYADPGSLSARLAPPYDVISTEERRALARQDRANIVHVDLPLAPPGEDPYEQAAHLLSSWQRQRLLVREDEPCAYVLRTTIVAPDGSEGSRTGVFLAVAAVHFAPGSRVRPHERTQSEPKEDRRRLTLATGCNVSPVFLLVPDSRGDLAASLAAITAGDPWAVADALGARHEVWIVPGQRALRLALLASDAQAYIADGHHRYESAAQFKEEAPKPWRLGAQRTLAYVVSFRDPGLAILPVHRIIEGRALERAAVLRAANPYFGRALAGQRPALTAVFADGTEAAMALRPEADLTGVADLPLHPAVRSLAATQADTVFIRVVVGSVIGRAPSVKYTPDETEARTAVREGRAALAVVVPPPLLDDVTAVSDAGEALPPRSTYVAPKVPTGIVMRLLEGEV